MSPQHHNDQDGPAAAVFGPDWTVTPRVAVGLLGITQHQVLRLIERGELSAQYEGRVRLVELDSLFTYRRNRPSPFRPAAHSETDEERTHDH